MIVKEIITYTLVAKECLNKCYVSSLLLLFYSSSLLLFPVDILIAVHLIIRSIQQICIVQIAKFFLDELIDGIAVWWLGHRCRQLLFCWQLLFNFFLFIVIFSVVQMIAFLSPALIHFFLVFCVACATLVLCNLFAIVFHRHIRSLLSIPIILHLLLHLVEARVLALRRFAFLVHVCREAHP